MCKAFVAAEQNPKQSKAKTANKLIGIAIVAYISKYVLCVSSKYIKASRYTKGLLALKIITEIYSVHPL